MKDLKKIIPLGLLSLVLLGCSALSQLAVRSTSTPEITPPPTLTPTSTSTPIPTPTPTPVPAARISEGDQALFNGDWEGALGEFQTALDSSTDPEIRTAALLGLGKTHYYAGELELAREILQTLVAQEEDSQDNQTFLPDAYFFLGQTYSALEQYSEAAESFSRYLSLRPGVIDRYIKDFQGDALFAAGDYTGAIGAYQAAVHAPGSGDDLDIEIKIARAYALSGDLATALVGYQDIYDRSSNDYTKAQMDWYIGQTYTAIGDMENAYAAYQDAVDNFPLSYDAYQSLLLLIEDGVPVDELNRGLVDYYAGQYGLAAIAFDRYLIGEPEDPATALYYKGLAQREVGDDQEAIKTWDRLIKSYPDGNHWDDAWEEKAYTQWAYLDQYVKASNTLIDFVDQNPAHPRAAEFLFDAATVAERGGKLEQAALLWDRAGTEYPGSDQGFRALFLSGITRYRLADYLAAYAAFQKSLTLADAKDQKAAAFLWMGKAQQSSGDEAAALAEWSQAAAIDPTGYYSERASDLLAGRPPFTPPGQYDLGFDLKSERAEAEAWMRTVFSLPLEADLSGTGALAGDARLQRGDELWRLGLSDQARLEFEDLRRSVQTDPVGTYQLANHLIELGLYRPGILAMRQVLNLAGMDDATSLSAPAYFNHIRFGPYFRDLVIETAQMYNFHPLFLFSVMRQESLFEGFVRSSAGARGLMQIVPATGDEIARLAKWPPDYTEEDLYRPVVSVRLGAEYLNRQRSFLGGDLYAMLAAYNGGPGNASTWKNLVPPDPDLELEVIRFEETRNYIMRIYEIFNIYRRLYDRTP